MSRVSQFEMLTGALPFQGKDRKETMNLILKSVVWPERHKATQANVPTHTNCRLSLSAQSSPGDASVPERRGAVPAEGAVQEEPRQPPRSVSCGSAHTRVTGATASP